MRKLWSKLLNPGGGLRYHARAYRYRNSLWSPFRNELKGWLSEWMDAPTAAETELLLIAPSGGYCLPGHWLATFRSVTAIDLDPVAEVCFRRLHRQHLRRLTWQKSDVFECWQELLETHPSHALLFCNFLGQAAECDADRAAHWFQVLPRSLEKRRWASFHDLLSGPLKLRNAPPTLNSSERKPPADLLVHFYAANARGELCEHELPKIFPANQSYRYWGWKLAPDQHHIIEGFHA